ATLCPPCGAGDTGPAAQPLEDHALVWPRSPLRAVLTLTLQPAARRVCSSVASFSVETTTPMRTVGTEVGAQGHLACRRHSQPPRATGGRRGRWLDLPAGRRPRAPARRPLSPSRRTRRVRAAGEEQPEGHIVVAARVCPRPQQEQRRR